MANQTIGQDLAEEIRQIFCEVIIAPEFTDEAREIFGKKKNLRLMNANGSPGASSLQEIRAVPDGFLLQDRDGVRINPATFKVVTDREPTAEEWDSLLFGWKVVRHVKSNAIVYAAGERTLGVGAGQMSRVDSSKIAVWKAGEAGLSLEGSVVASDAFFLQPVNEIPSCIFFFSGKPLCFVLANFLASLTLISFATSATSGDGFSNSPFCAARTMPKNLCCFLETAGIISYP